MILLVACAYFQNYEQFETKEVPMGQTSQEDKKPSWPSLWPSLRLVKTSLFEQCNTRNGSTLKSSTEGSVLLDIFIVIIKCPFLDANSIWKKERMF